MSSDIRDPKAFRQLLESFQSPYRAISEDSSNAEGIAALEELQEQLYAIIDGIQEVVYEYLPEQSRSIEAYLLATLKVAAGSDEYMSNDMSIQKLIDMLEENRDEADDEEF